MNYNTAFVIGNGESRKPVDLEKLRNHGYIFGCNALVRDFHPDYLVALDRKMEKEIEKSDYDGYKIYRYIGARKPGRIPPKSPKTYVLNITPRECVNSGVAAVYLALKIGLTNIWLLGFDLGHNNIYQGTSNYARITAAARKKEPKRVQIHKTIAKWAKANPHVRFRRLYDSELCFDPHEWKDVIENVTLEKFNELYT